MCGCTRARSGLKRTGPKRGIATALLQAGIAPDCVVLAFHPPNKRSLTEFAIA